MPKFSANLGLLWPDLTLPDAIVAAHRAGFEAVECHWPNDVPPGDVKSALAKTGMSMLSLNTARGGDSQFGLTAIPDMKTEARNAIDQALIYARSIAAPYVHVMAGIAHGEAAHQTFIENLIYASELARDDLTLLIEPINHFDVPGYYLNTTDQAVGILRALNSPNVKLLFDCYHVARNEGQVLERLKSTMPYIGHIQFAGVPERGDPSQGSLDYRPVFEWLDQSGYVQPLGAEYKPNGPTEDGLNWMQTLAR